VDDYHQRIHTGIQKDEGIEISPCERYKSGIELVGAPTIPNDWEQLRFDLLPFKKRTLQRNGIEMFHLVYYDPIIAKLRSMQKSKDASYLVKYDPRDIREVYLWADQLNQYCIIRLKDTFRSELLINPEDPNDFPLALKELDAIQNRQKDIDEARERKKTAKKARKQKEHLQITKESASSTQIRANKQELTAKSNDSEIPIEINSDKEEPKKDLDWLKKTRFPSRSNWDGKKR
jgi:putative transposase